MVNTAAAQFSEQPDQLQVHKDISHGHMHHVLAAYQGNVDVYMKLRQEQVRSERELSSLGIESAAMHNDSAL